MDIPPWLAKATGANPFAMNPANGFNPTVGDAMQGIGHSMMEHYRRNSAPQTPAAGGGGNPMLGILGGMIPPMGILGNQLMQGMGGGGAPAPLAHSAPPSALPSPVDFQLGGVDDILGKIAGQGPANLPQGLTVGQAAKLFR